MRPTTAASAEEITERNHADPMVYNVEKMLKEHRSKISEADAKAVEDALEETKKAVQSGNLDEIRAATDKLTQASHKLAEAMYRARVRRAGPAGAPGDGAAAAQERKAERQCGRRRIRRRRRQEVSQ